MGRRKGGRRRSPSQSTYHRRQTRANWNAAPEAGPVTIRKADGTETVEDPYHPSEVGKIVAEGQRNADPKWRTPRSRNTTTRKGA